MADSQEKHCELEQVKSEVDFFVMSVTQFKTNILIAFENQSFFYADSQAPCDEYLNKF